MKTYTVMVSAAHSRIRLLLLDQSDEIMRAELPTNAHTRHPRALPSLLEGLSLWLTARLHVVVSADALETSFCPELMGDLGLAIESVFYHIEIVEPRRRRGRRLKGVGHFSDLRQLSLTSGAAR